MRSLILTFLLIISISCSPSSEQASEDIIPNTDPIDISLGFIETPSGFSVEVFSDQVPGARQITVSPSGVVYVGTRKTGESGKVYAVVDRDKDFVADTVYTIASGLRMPNGVAFKDGDLYVAEVSKIWKFENIEADLSKPPTPILINDDYPTETSHGWKYISFGPDGKLYVPVGAPCNICNHEEDNPLYASLTRINTDGTGREIVAHGIRNTVGFTWHPTTNNLWFTENGRDWLGDDSPACELNEITEEGQHFGFPYLHASSVWDPEFGEAGKARESEFKKPVQELGPHVAPLGVIFYEGDMFPSEYKHQALIAEHGSWNRSEKIGYRISLVSFDKNGEAISYQPFITGWLQGEEDVRGRPVSLFELPDGSILISDDYAGKIYRVSYNS